MSIGYKKFDLDVHSKCIKINSVFSDYTTLNCKVDKISMDFYKDNISHVKRRDQILWRNKLYPTGTIYYIWEICFYHFQTLNSVFCQDHIKDSFLQLKFKRKMKNKAFNKKRHSLVQHRVLEIYKINQSNKLYVNIYVIMKKS